MSFYCGEEQLETLVVDGDYPPNKTTNKPEITILNTETLGLDVSKLSVPTSVTDLHNFGKIDIMKIIVDWGDGTPREEFCPPVVVQNSSINTPPEVWGQTTHTYKLTSVTPHITLSIFAYNLLNDCATILVPMTVIFQSFVQQTGKWTLVSANITNENTVSYVLNDGLNLDNIVVTSTKIEE